MRDNRFNAIQMYFNKTNERGTIIGFFGFSPIDFSIKIQNLLKFTSNTTYIAT